MNIVDTLLNDSPSSKKRIFNILVLLVITFSLILTITNYTNNFVNLFLLSTVFFFIAQTYLYKENTTISDFYGQTTFKIIYLQDIVNKQYFIKRNRIVKSTSRPPPNAQYNNPKQLDYLHHDANLVNFLYSISDLSKYNIDSFTDLLIQIDLLLNIKHLVNSNSENSNELADIAHDVHIKIMNIAHSLIYTVPKTTSMYKYHETLLKRLHILTLRTMDDISKLSPSRKKFYKLGFPRPLDKSSSTYDLF